MFTADAGTAGNRWPVVRLRAGCSTEVCLLSDRFFALTTHWHRCTVLCSVEGCMLCDLLPPRGLFYVAVMCVGRVHLLELGALSASNLEQHLKLLHGGMGAGRVLKLHRRGSKSPVHSEFDRQEPGASGVSRLELIRHTLALYKYPPPNPGEQEIEYEGRIRAMVQRRNELLAGQLLRERSTGTQSRA